MSRQTSRGEAPVATLCVTFGISRAAYYAVKERMRAQPCSGAKSNVVRLPRRPNVASAEQVLVAVRKIIQENLAWGVRKVWAMLRREHGLNVSRKRVWTLMRGANLVLARDREPGDPPRGNVTTELPNRRFATDITTVWTKREGWVAITPTIDCGCRTLLALPVSKAQDALTILSSVREALVAAFGDPSNVSEGLELRTDHGPQYTGADCEALVRHWGLDHTYAPIGWPTGDAVVERVIRTMKEELLWLRDWNDAEEIRLALADWRRAYSERRPHQARAWRTPAEVRRAA